MKKLLVMMLMVAMSVAMLIGCNSGEEVTSEPVSETESEVVSEEVSEEVSDIASEEVSEEVSEEEVADYSAEAVMAKIDELIAACPYDDPEQIKAAVIGVNLEYISDEDLTTLMNTYGYTLEELKDLFDDYMEQYLHHIWLTNRWNIGAGEIIDTMNEEQDLLKYRANIVDMYIGQEEARVMAECIVMSLSTNENSNFYHYVLPENNPATDKCPYNYQSTELTDNNKAILNYILLYNEVYKCSTAEILVERLECTLPFDAKLNVQ